MQEDKVLLAEVPPSPERLRLTVGRRRNTNIDVLRATAIIAVVLNHALLASVMKRSEAAGYTLWRLATVGFPPGVWVPEAAYRGLTLNVVVSFHVALFAFLAGLCTRPEALDSGAFLYNRFKRLMVPYLAWLIITLVATVRPIRLVPPYLLRGLVDMHSVGSLWFLYALFLSYCALKLIRVLTRAPSLLAGSAAVGLLLSAFPQLPVLRYLGDVLWLYPFMVVGFLMSSRVVSFQSARRPAVWVTMLPLFAVLLWLLWPPLLASRNALNSGTAGIPGMLTYAVLRYSAAAALIVFLAGASRAIPDAVKRPMAYLGSRTIGVYGSHSLLIGPLLMAGVDKMPSWLAPAALLAGTLAASLAIALLIERTDVGRVLLLGLHPLSKNGRTEGEIQRQTAFRLAAYATFGIALVALGLLSVSLRPSERTIRQGDVVGLVRICAVGDSNTQAWAPPSLRGFAFGWGVGKREQYLFRLMQRLEPGSHLQFATVDPWPVTDPRSPPTSKVILGKHHAAFNLGFAGATAGEIRSRWGELVHPFRPHIVIIWAGTNDVRQGRPVDEIIRDLRWIIEQSARDESRPIIYTVATWSDATVAERESLAALNSAIVDLSSDTNVQLVDLASLLDANGDGVNDFPYTSFDSLHFNADGHRTIAASLPYDFLNSPSRNENPVPASASGPSWR